MGVIVTIVKMYLNRGKFIIKSVGSNKNGGCDYIGGAYKGVRLVHRPSNMFYYDPMGLVRWSIIV